eukprot:CAMPEP_0118631682 /NCGR_PEP_ID=MMETSP0785-20121206/33_1 /TAXON_ID=91992 /ORGANISM="Bolidomonas pacifica, Strain CCMP 1866" /LENGTH=65 /DNA_ID=CAMNT_0006522385 /DNA_START=51 /DNA_END=248 /DNA_ORIENTATION=+
MRPQISQANDPVLTPVVPSVQKKRYMLNVNISCIHPHAERDILQVTNLPQNLPIPADPLRSLVAK